MTWFLNIRHTFFLFTFFIILFIFYEHLNYYLYSTFKTSQRYVVNVQHLLFIQVVRTPSPTFGTFPDTPSYHDHYLPTSTPSHQRPSGSSFSTSIVTTLSQSRPPGSLFGTQVNSTAVNANPPMRVRVQIQGKTFLIPCPESSDGERKTIAWLAEQVMMMMTIVMLR